MGLLCQHSIYPPTDSATSELLNDKSALIEHLMKNFEKLKQENLLFSFTKEQQQQLQLILQKSIEVINTDYYQTLENFSQKKHFKTMPTNSPSDIIPENLAFTKLPKNKSFPSFYECCSLNRDILPENFVKTELKLHKSLSNKSAFKPQQTINSKKLEEFLLNQISKSEANIPSMLFFEMPLDNTPSLLTCSHCFRSLGLFAIYDSIVLMV